MNYTPLDYSGGLMDCLEHIGAQMPNIHKLEQSVACSQGAQVRVGAHMGSFNTEIPGDGCTLSPSHLAVPYTVRILLRQLLGRVPGTQCRPSQ